MTGCPAHDFHEYDRSGDRADLLTTWARCDGCGLGLRRRYLKGVLYEVRVQVSRLGDWIDPLDLIARPNPYEACAVCKGRAGRCRGCRGTGVTAGGATPA